jgi:hypothetical protein
MWSRIGRLSRSTFPKLTGGGHVFGGGASPGALGCLAGRLLCDTYLAGERGGFEGWRVRVKVEGGWWRREPCIAFCVHHPALDLSLTHV